LAFSSESLPSADGEPDSSDLIEMVASIFQGMEEPKQKKIVEKTVKISQSLSKILTPIVGAIFASTSKLEKEEILHQFLDSVEMMLEGGVSLMSSGDGFENFLSTLHKSYSKGENPRTAITKSIQKYKSTDEDGGVEMDEEIDLAFKKLSDAIKGVLNDNQKSKNEKMFQIVTMLSTFVLGFLIAG